MTNPTTMCQAFQATVKGDPGAVALRIVGGAQTVTWRQCADKVRALAGGLAGLGVGRQDTVALMLTNRPEFNIVDVAAFHLGAVPFSLYNTNSVDQIAFVLANAGSRVVVCERQFLDKIRAAGGPVEHIVVVDDAPEGTISLDGLEQLAEPGFDFEAAWKAVQPTDVLTIIYTSGTTGDPKGVQLTHAGMLAQMDALSQVIDFKRGDRQISYLPSAHVGDRFSAHYAMIVYGVQVTTVADPRAIAAALPEAQPTIWAAVPRVWEKLETALGLAFEEAEGTKATLLHSALELAKRKVRAQARGEDLGLLDKVKYQALDKIVLSKVREKLGLQDLRWAFSGGAPIVAETVEFFLALGIRICEGWGMSEIGGGVALNPPGRPKAGSVGPVLPGSEIKIAEDGELLVRSPSVMLGYRNDPVRTAEAIDTEGWLHTGDVGRVDEDGYIFITDRKKDLIITATAKNVAPAAIENAVKVCCSLVGQVVPIGDNRKYISALVVLDADAAAAFARKHDLDPSPEALAVNPKLVATVTAGIAEANGKLNGVEQIKRFRIVRTFWEPGGDEVTPSMKVRRRAVMTKYAAEIESLYADSSGEVHEVRTR
ncbi:long-subunit acyl-CoA synthetase (AMP-forming) [Nocardia tenerifensis]|uniref:Long-subunit acyl-CoA synthetase (AMP-forming) n=1 Tax=Nocardia tenerifensis TaxID=228006 RepID=A0A318JVX3_9NOCA|nr:AMP-binding protein [Nocardia tenerifensis]PXX58463.1 long-subunit acyl-CoA synthetase (AMP-forming) [Nocardia tenerifensis]